MTGCENGTGTVRFHLRKLCRVFQAKTVNGVKKYLTLLDEGWLVAAIRFSDDGLGVVSYTEQGYLRIGVYLESLPDPLWDNLIILRFILQDLLPLVDVCPFCIFPYILDYSLGCSINPGYILYSHRKPPFFVW